MAGDWIKVEHTLPDKPEVDRIAAFLRVDHNAVVGLLIRFWVWADQQSVNGNALTVTENFIDRVVGQKRFAESLKNVGWLIEKRGVFSIPNFDRHNGKTAKTRATTKDRVKRFRNDDDVTKPLPEKRREELNTNPPTPQRGTASPGISISDLSNPKAIERWRNRRAKSLSLGTDHTTLVWLNAAALRAIEQGDNGGVALFISLAKEIAAGDTSKLETFYDQAKQRLNPAAALAASNGVDHADEN